MSSCLYQRARTHPPLPAVPRELGWPVRFDRPSSHPLPSTHWCPNNALSRRALCRANAGLASSNTWACCARRPSSPLGNRAGCTERPSRKLTTGATSAAPASPWPVSRQVSQVSRPLFPHLPHPHFPHVPPQVVFDSTSRKRSSTSHVKKQKSPQTWCSITGGVAKERRQLGV